jgi:hypothetical protein
VDGGDGDGGEGKRRRMAMAVRVMSDGRHAEEDDEGWVMCRR